ncbi:MAG: penicillin-binding transpeptidase domain-containing protein [Verrucomicrobia bacterium]|nr:penicillin-binding transpeptidase domain-containing protein [Verrucomicrobiota bacterium]
MDHQTGGIRAWIGSPKWTGTRGRINGVTLPRSAGSILKPLLYLQAIDERILTAATLMPDTPDAISAEYVDYDPRNYDQRFWGPVRVREALANSLNVPAVVTLARLGARKAFTGLQNAGIRTARDLHDYGAGLILGNAEIRLLDITAAFGVFANQGRLAQPRFTQDSPPAHRIISSPESAQILADILSDNEARRKSFGPFTPLAFESRRIPCKTGTSSGFRDAWTVGSTGRHTIGVWLGNFSGSPMKELASVTGPAPLWRDIIVQLLGADPDLPPPVASAKLSQQEICALTGVKPTADSPARVKEWFLTGTEPSTNAESYFQPDLDGKKHLVLPAVFDVWCHSSHNYLGATASISDRLRIVLPRAGASFVLDPHLSGERQRIELRAAGASGMLHWKLDGQTYATCQPDVTVTWPLTPGTHELEVTDGKTTSAVNFTVER